MPSLGESEDLSNKQVSETFDIIDSYLKTNPDTAIALCKTLLEKSEEHENFYGITRANFWIAYLLEEKQEYGEAITYYLEGIRYSGKVSYKSHIADKIWMRRNLANTFRTHGVNELATRYNLEGIQIAAANGVLKQVVSLKLNQGLVYENEEQYDKAITYYRDVIRLSDSIQFETDLRKYKMLNQIGLVHLYQEEYDSALLYFNQLLDITDSTYLRFKAQALHNIGEIYYEGGEVMKTISYLKQSIGTLDRDEEQHRRPLFYAYRNLGSYLAETKQIDEAVVFLSKAESLMPYVSPNPSTFKVYKNISDLHYSIGNEELGAAYLKLYNNEMEAYHGVEKENLELIAYRFYEKVEKEERIASIMFYAKLVGGILLGGFILVVAYTRVRSVRVRRSKEALKHEKMVADLKALKAQINPHFLFNSLNSIQSFILEGEGSLADDYLVKYGKLMRMILNHSNELTVYMEEELAALKLYVELEQLRLDKPLNFAVKVAAEIDSSYTKVPSMVIQPLLENAIWHGIQPKDGAGELSLEITKKDHWILIVLIDNGVGFDLQRKEETKPHGLKLAQERIDIFNEVNGVDAVFYVTSSREGTRIEFSFPADLR